MRDTLLVGEIHHGQPAFVSAVSRSDVASNEIVAAGLSIPRSPRWYRDRLWVCNSGTGEFGTVDLASGAFEPLTFCAGYLRGVEARCAIQVVDLRSGDAVHWLRFEGLVDELYDVITLPGARNPSLIGFVSDEIRRLISIEEAG